MTMTLSGKEVEGIFKTLSVGGPVATGTSPMHSDSCTYMYFKWPETWRDGTPCPAAGRVLKAQASAVAFMHATLKKQLVPLSYGRFQDVNSNLNLDPFRNLFLAGGAKEFPIFQIRENFWHRKPPVYTLNGSRVQVMFPQLTINPETGNVIDNGVELVDVKCPDCPGDVWFTTESGMRAHMATEHKLVAAQRATAHEMGEATKSIAEALQASQGSQNETLVAAFASLTDAILKMDERQRALESILANNVQSRVQDRPNRPAG